ncbi:ATP-binding protein [Lacrimispora sp.]|uniref:ATP-binding protein n=1 Tax=Lacrimispora sp. TaxID=2719234 RepID=UPI0028A91DAB|nr:ATP-binding protein [Lacrimispora sp.]
MSKIQTEIGTVYSVNGNSVAVSMSDSVKSNSPIIDGIVYRIGQIGSFLKIPLGYTSLYGIVTQIGADAIPDKVCEAIKENFDLLSNQQWLSMTLVGEQIGQRFERGISQSPTTGDAVHIVTIQDLEIVYGGYDENSSIDIGHISVSESLNAYLDLDKLVSRHFAILGSTGSGKSNAVGITLKSIIQKKFGRSRILLLDPHGEYNSVFGEDSEVFRINTDKNANHLYIPYWALSFQEFVKLFDGNISEQNKEYFRTKVLEAKQKGAIANNINIDQTMISADSPIPFSLKQLWYEMDDFERQTYNVNNDPTKLALEKEGDAETLVSNQYKPVGSGNAAPFLNKAAKYMLPFLDSIRTKLQDRRFDFLFRPGEYAPDLSGKVAKDLFALLFSWIGSEKPISILDISDVPSDIMMSIAGTLLNITYEALFWGQEIEIGGRKQPLLIVLEEAHNYLRSGENSIASRNVQRIAKEGRKYGVGLMLVTQRPSELDETVLSQCGTIIALRMNNSKDRGYVSAAIQDELHSIVDLLPSLRTGEAIVSGEGVSIPSRIQFNKLANAPKSADPVVSKQWNQPYAQSEDDYKKLLSLWRNKKFEMEEKIDE